MKKLITIVLLAALALPAAAQELVLTEEQAQPQEQKWTVRGSAGYYPTIPTVALPFIAIAVGLANNNNETDKTDITFPPFSQVEVLYSFNHRWSAGLGIGYSGFEMITKDKTTGDVKNRAYFTLLPVTAIGRCNYLNRPAVKLYGSLEAGVFFPIDDGEFQIVPNLQLNPIGVEFGRKLFGMVELGIGMNYVPLRVGLGYRF